MFKQCPEQLNASGAYASNVAQSTVQRSDSSTHFKSLIAPIIAASSGRWFERAAVVDDRVSRLAKTIVDLRSARHTTMNTMKRTCGEEARTPAAPTAYGDASLLRGR